MRRRPVRRKSWGRRSAQPARRVPPPRAMDGAAGAARATGASGAGGPRGADSRPLREARGAAMGAEGLLLLQLRS